MTVTCAVVHTMPVIRNDRHRVAMGSFIFLLAHPFSRLISSDTDRLMTPVILSTVDALVRWVTKMG
jgi:hypothetical protein